MRLLRLLTIWSTVFVIKKRSKIANSSRENNLKIAALYLNQKNKRIDKAYDYLVPSDLENELKSGMRVLVNFGRGNRELEGFVVRIKKTNDQERKLKAIRQLIDQEPVLDRKQIEFCIWMKDYYCNLFYENLAYFVSPLPIIRERFIERKMTNNTLAMNVTIQAYFSQNSRVNYKKIKQEDRKVIAQMIDSGYLIEKKTYRVYQESKEKIYYRTDNRLLEKPRLGLVQKKIMSLLETRALKESTLKQLIPQYKNSIASLIKKGFIGEEITAKNFGEKNHDQDQGSQRPVILSENEQSLYDYYHQLKNKDCFFLCHDHAAKYRLLFKLIQEQIKNRKSVLILFPDINLSYQRLELFIKYFGESLAIFHHKLRTCEQRNIYQTVKNGQTRLIIGVQGAIFLPFRKLGLIIVDDEHSQSYHSMGSPKFHIPDLVQNYGRILDIPCILMDEIPRIKTWYEVSTGKIGLLAIGRRSQLEGLKTVDMHQEMLNGNFKMISHCLSEGITNNLHKKQLSVLLINRTGYSNGIICRACGQVLTCPDCKIALKYNSQKNSLSCNYCDYQKSMVQNCPNCGKRQLRHLGVGIDQVQKNVSDQFPNARIAVVQGGLSLDEIKGINGAIRGNKIDILIGTQVLNKHYSFHNIGLAACLLIDRDLKLGGFDASEMTYQIYAQFFKKALKQGAKGIIQTNEPQNDTILSIIENDFEAYYRDEIEFRRILKYPPFYEMIELKVSNQDRDWASNDALRLYILIRDYCKLHMEAKTFYLFKANDRGLNKKGKWDLRITLKCLDLRAFQKMMDYFIKNGEIEKIKSPISFKIKK